ncbi:hypothetical protein UES1_451 [Escherichia phage UE-S1]|nr:hypothetical protein UES1_451 [Escherichia phage UE-S1]
MSSKRIIGSAEILGNLAIGGKYAMRTFNGTSPDANTGIVNYPIYNRSEVQRILDMLPISRIGEMDYLPLNVNGSYEGATSNSDIYRVQPTIIEDDGTGVVLRAGTNGSEKGFYYSFIRDLRNVSSLTQDMVISTTSKYKPSILSAGESVTRFIGSNGYELLVSYTSNLNYIFTLTNGTFNETSHIHAKLVGTQFNTDKPLYAHIVGANIFIWCKDTTVTNGGMAYTLYTVSKSDVINGTMTSFAKVTGFSGQTVRNTSYSSSNNIRVFDSYFSTNSDSDSLFVINSPVNSVEYIDYNDYNIQANASSDNSRIRVTLYITPRFSTPLIVSPVFATGISFVYTISSKSMSLDGSARAPVTVSYTNNKFVVSNQFEISMSNFTGSKNSLSSLGDCGSICQTTDGLVFTSKSRWVSDETYGLQLYKVQGTPYDSWVASSRKASDLINVNVKPTYGSAVGENLLGVRFIDTRKILLACSSTSNGVTYGYDSTVYSQIGENPTHTYNSVTTGKSIEGFAPESERKYLGNSYDYSAMISLIAEDGTVRSYGSSFIEGITKDATGLLDPVTMTFSGKYTISDATLMELKQSIITSSKISGTSTSRICFYYVPDTTFSRSMAVVCTYSPTNNQGYAIFAEVDVVLSGSEITSASVYSTRYEVEDNVSGIQSNAILKRCTGMTVAKYTGFNYLGIDTIHQFTVPGDVHQKMMIAKVKNGDISSNRYFTTYHVNANNSFAFQHGAIPNVGFGYYNFNISDLQTKAVFSVFGTTEAQMDGLIAGTGAVLNNYVIVSQDVAQGFNVYFTRDVPVFLGGMFDRLPVQSIDLKTIKTNPANSTFYIYIQMDRNTGKAAYVISTTLLDETLTNVYIGNIITGSTSITSIDTEKVTRFLTYRPSTTKRGSAIPASTGVPSGPGSRWK